MKLGQQNLVIIATKSIDLQWYLTMYLEGNINISCISESFNTNISNQLFDYKITFVNSQHENTKSKGDLVLKKQF